MRMCMTIQVVDAAKLSMAAWRVKECRALFEKWAPLAQRIYCEHDAFVAIVNLPHDILDLERREAQTRARIRERESRQGCARRLRRPERAPGGIRWDKRGHAFCIASK